MENSGGGLVMKALAMGSHLSSGMPLVDVRAVAAAAIFQAMHGSERDTLTNKDLKHRGRVVLSKKL